MKVYLVYGLDLDDSCEEPFVKKVFANKDKADKYARESSLDRAFVEEKELEIQQQKQIELKNDTIFPSDWVINSFTKSCKSVEKWIEGYKTIREEDRIFSISFLPELTEAITFQNVSCKM